MSSYYFVGQTTNGGPIVGTTGTFSGSVTSGGVFAAADGTAPLPAFTFTGQLSTGMWRPATGVVGLTGAGVEVARFSATLAQVPAASVLTWNGRSKISCAVDGGINITSNAGTGATYLTLGAEGSSAAGKLTYSGTGSWTVGRGDGGSTDLIVTSDIYCGNGRSFIARNSFGGFGSLATLATQSGTLSGATTSIASAIPAGAVVLGVSARVTTAIPTGGGTTSFSIGDGTNATAFGANIACALATTTTPANWTLTSAPVYPGGANIVLTANGANFSGGVVRVMVTYITTAAPTS